MAGFGKTDGPQDLGEDVIVIHLGHLSDEQYNRIVDSITAFMNARWPNIAHMGIDN